MNKLTGVTILVAAFLVGAALLFPGELQAEPAPVSAAANPVAAQNSSSSQPEKKKKSASATSKTGSKSKKATKGKGRGRAQMAPTPDRIKEIQSALQREGVYEGEPTGKWDQATTDAMMKFQDKNGISPTGKIDALSLEKLGLGSQTAGKGAPVPVATNTGAAPSASSSGTTAKTSTSPHSGGNAAAPPSDRVSPADPHTK